MDTVQLVNVQQGLEGLVGGEGHLRLGHLHRVELLEHLGEAAAAHELHHDPELVLDNVRGVVVDNVRVAARLHDRDLGDEQLETLAVELHLLDGDLVARLVERKEHLAGGTLADLLHVAVDLVRVVFADQLVCRGRGRVRGRSAEYVSERDIERRRRRRRRRAVTTYQA